MKKLLISLLLVNACSLEAISFKRGKLAKIAQVAAAKQTALPEQAKVADSVAQVGQEPLSFTTSTNIPACFNGNATATVTPAGGTPPYLVTINGVTVTTPPYVFSLPAVGDIPSQTTPTCPTLSTQYLVTVTDSEAPAVTVTGFLETPIFQPENDIQITGTSSTAVTCPGATNGSVTLTAFLSDPAFAITWTLNGQTISTGAGITTVTFDNLVAGTYQATATITDTSLCAVATVVIRSPAPIVITYTTTPQVIYPTASLGSVTITITGGTPPYTGAFDGIPFTGSGPFPFGNLEEGTYTISLVDSLGCPATATITVQCARQQSTNAIANFITTKYCQGECIIPS